jgi:hypothetical protein
MVAALAIPDNYGRLDAVAALLKARFGEAIDIGQPSECWNSRGPAHPSN